MGDQNVVRIFLVEFCPALDGQWEQTELIATLHECAAASSVECLAELAFDQCGTERFGSGWSHGSHWFRNRCPHLRLRTSRLVLQLRQQPIKSIEVVVQPFLSVILRVTENSDRLAGFNFEADAAYRPMCVGQLGGVRGFQCPCGKDSILSPVSPSRMRIRSSQDVGHVFNVPVTCK